MEFFKRVDTYTCIGESTTGIFRLNLTPYTNLNYESIYFNNTSVVVYDNSTPANPIVINSSPIILKCNELGTDFSLALNVFGELKNPIMVQWNKPLPLELNFNLFSVDINGVLQPLFSTGNKKVIYSFTIQFIIC